MSVTTAAMIDESAQGGDNASTEPLSSKIRRIVERSLAPAERSETGDSSPAPVITTDAEKLLERWERLVLLKTGDQQAFERRLAALELDRVSALQYLGARTLPASSAIPQWASVLEEAFDCATAARPCASQDELREFSAVEREAYHYDAALAPIFPEFLHPFITVALRRIGCAFPNLQRLLSRTAQLELAHWLLLKLSRLSVRAFSYEIKQRRYSGKLVGDTSEQRYRYFTNNVLGTVAGLADFCLQYPVLARLWAICVGQCVDATVELLQRLERDRAAIALNFEQRRELGALVSLLSGFSDPHRHGRSVCILQFESGFRLVYKPRSFTIDCAFNDVLGWLSAKPDAPSLRATRVLSGNGYGWSEFIAAEDCRSVNEVARFYERHGACAALIYFLCGMDFHYDNFIAHGEFPVPVDLEALMMTSQHTLPPDAGLPRYLQAVGLSTVLASSVCSYWRAGDYARPLFSATGIGGGGGRSWPTMTALWHGLGTDEMRLSREYRDFQGDDNLPSLDGRKVPVDDYIGDVVRGFSQTYRAILRHREELLDPAGPLMAFRDARTRRVLRDTSEYVGALFWALAPDHLVSGAAHDVALEILGGAVQNINLARPFEFLDAEKRCCWRQDVPYYYSSPSSVYVYAEDGRAVNEAIDRCCLDQALQRLTEACETDLLWQSELLRVSLTMGVMDRHTKPLAPAAPADSRRTDSMASWAALGGWPDLARLQVENEQQAAETPTAAIDCDRLRGRLLDEARAIGTALGRIALRHSAGTSWLSLVRQLGTTSAVAPVSPYPWHSMGAAATSVLFSNLARKFKDEYYAGLAKGALEFTESALSHVMRAGRFDVVPLSGFNGIGLPIYAMIEAGRCLGEEFWIDRATHWALQLDSKRLEAAENPDVLCGGAGLLLVLVHLYRCRRQAPLLERAVRLGRSIARRQQPDAMGWLVPGFERPLLGMGHGAAGIACALQGVYALTGDRKLRDAARAGVAFERKHFDNALQEWPDLRQPGAQTSFMTGWCAGAAGIGLARLAMLGDDDDELLEDIERAISATTRHLGRHHDHLCCGDSGRIMFLVNAAARLARPELHNLALTSAAQMVDAHRRRGCWRLQEFSERTIMPGLLDGVAGIGLTLLSVAEPESVSNVLLLA